MTADVTSESSRRGERRSRSPVTRAARSSVLNLAGAVASGISTFALTVAVTRGLAPSVAGVFFSVTSLFLLAATLGQLGTDTGLVYFISRDRALGQPGRIPSHVRAAVGPVTLLGVGGAVAILVFAGPLGQLTNPAHHDLATTTLRALAPFIPIAALEYVALSATRGMGSMRANVLIEQIGRPCLQLTLVAIAVWLSRAEWVGAAWSAAYLPAAVASWLTWRRLRTTYVGAWDGGRTSREFWRFTAPRSIASVAQIAMQRFDIILVAAIAGAVPAALYAAATRFVVSGQMARSAISLALQPHLAAALARPDTSESKHLYRLSTSWLMAVTWPLYLTFAIWATPLLGVFGHQYRSAASVLVLVALALTVASAFGDVDILLIMAGKTSWSLINVSLAFAVNLGLDLYLLPRYGIVGAAVGWASAILVKSGAALLQTSTLLRLHPFGKAPLTVASLNLIIFVALPVGVHSVDAGVRGLALSLVASALCYLGALWCTRALLEVDSLRRR